MRRCAREHDLAVGAIPANGDQARAVVEEHAGRVAREVRIPASGKRANVGHHGDWVLSSAGGRHPPQLEAELRATPGWITRLNGRVVDDERSRASRRTSEDESRAVGREIETRVHGWSAREIPRRSAIRVNFIDVAAIAVDPGGIQDRLAIGRPHRRRLDDARGRRQTPRRCSTQIHHPHLAEPSECHAAAVGGKRWLADFADQHRVANRERAFDQRAERLLDICGERNRSRLAGGDIHSVELTAERGDDGVPVGKPRRCRKRAHAGVRGRRANTTAAATDRGTSDRLSARLRLRAYKDPAVGSGDEVANDQRRLGFIAREVGERFAVAAHHRSEHAARKSDPVGDRSRLPIVASGLRTRLEPGVPAIAGKARGIAEPLELNAGAAPRVD